VTIGTANVTNLVNALADGSITAGKFATDSISSVALAASAVTEIQSGLATASALSTAQSGITDLQGRVPATLNSGRMRSHVEVVDTAAADTIANDVWEEALADHSGVAGSAAEALANISAGASPTDIADAVWDEALSGHPTAGTAGKALTDAAAGTGGGSSSCDFTAEEG
jgi:hypothetical protein